MALFRYSAVNNNGIEDSGQVEASSKEDAIAKLRAEYEIVTTIKEVREKEDFRDTLNIRKIDEKSLALVCEQFAIILKSGMPIVRTIDMVADQTDDKYMKALLQGVSADVEAGHSVAESFAERGPKLPVTFIETIRAGEESGSLDNSFAKLSSFFKKKAKVREKVVSALTYPAFVVGVAIVVIYIIMVKAVPEFTTAFESMDMELPLPTRMVMGLSDFFVKFWWVFLVLIIGIFAWIKYMQSKLETKIQLDEFKLKLPILGKVHWMDGCSQFANTLSMLMASGLPAMRAIEITGRSMSNSYLGSKVKEAVYDVRDGYRIGDSIRNKDCFPSLLTEMTAIGEESGSLESTLEVVGEYYDNEVDVVTERATKLLEPTIICILAIFVVIVLLAVYAPMFGMYDAVDQMY